MTTLDADNPDLTRPLQSLPPEAPAYAEPQPVATPSPLAPVEAANGVVAGAVAPRGEILYVPLAVSVGDGFKFGCGFFMAFVVAMLFGFVLVSALFAMGSLLGVGPFLSP